MIRKSVSLTARALVVGMLVSGSVIAGGGRGGDGSMNPFTGNSYAYFHGGHNLGEEGMNLPARTPLRRSRQACATSRLRRRPPARPARSNRPMRVATLKWPIRSAVRPDAGLGCES